jgi:hypothetical protein
MTVTHTSDEEIEQYVRGQLGNPGSRAVLQVEKHLLRCPSCVLRAERAVELGQAMREALATLFAHATSSPFLGYDHLTDCPECIWLAAEYHRLEEVYVTAEALLNDHESNERANIYCKIKSAAGDAHLDVDIARLLFERHKSLHVAPVAIAGVDSSDEPSVLTPRRISQGN